MFKKTILHEAAFCVLAMAGSAPIMAAPLNFADTPPGTGHKPPRPNVILSLDNSGSMAFDINECRTPESIPLYGGGIVQGGVVYVRTNAGQAHCRYELSSGGYGTRNQTGGWGNFRIHTIGGQSYFKADPDEARINTLKNSLATAMTNVVTDGSIRLAWQALHNNGESFSATSLTQGAANAMRMFEGTHRATFQTYLSSLRPRSGTPSHRLMQQAHNYMSSSAGINSPWAKEPGVTETPYLECRRAYHIFLTDGAWNSQNNSMIPSGNLDENSVSNVGSSSGESYNPSAGYAKVFRGSESGTLADWAFKSWVTDLQPDIANGVLPLPDYVNAPNTTTVGGVTIPKFWNPRLNPATWQHLTTFTIGYGRSAYAWTGFPQFDQSWVTAGPTVLADNYAGDFNQLYATNNSWPTLNVGNAGDVPAFRPSDLWHMALNSRGKFYPVDSGVRLTAAFTEIFQRISADTQPGTTSTTASGSNNVFTDVGLFTSTFDSSKAWKGYVEAWTLDVNGQKTPNTTWGMNGTDPRNTADMLDALTENDIRQRVILTTNDATQQGVPFVWQTASGTHPLSNAQRAALSNGQADPEGENRVNFLRGSRLLEGADPNFRVRQSRQGDIVNSSIWYVGKPASGYGAASYLQFANSTRQNAGDAMIYVGGNDGMLHGFSAQDGTERIAYVPKGLVPGLHALTLPNYGHQFYVDGSPFAGDAEINSTWKTVLVGTLGAGGRGYFVLDVTDPQNFSVNNAANLVLLDATEIPRSPTGQPDPAGVDADLGHIFGAPVRHETYPMRAAQVAKMNNNRWAVVLGNGYNSANEKPVLYIQYLDGAREVHKIQAITAATATPENTAANGLSAPRLMDINGDDQPDVIYAGDLKGNLWKFDVTSNSPNDWGVAFGGQPLFTACERTAGGQVVSPCVRQPITVAPTVRAHPNGNGVLVAFGTGRNLTMVDRSDTEQQAIYSVLDNTRYKLRNTGSNLLEVHPGGTQGNATIPAPQALPATTVLISQAVTPAVQTGTGASVGTNFWATSHNVVDWNNPQTKGWFLNLPESGERLLETMPFYDGSNILAVNSQVPARGSADLLDETCTAVPESGERYLTLLNIVSGLPPSVQLMDLDGDGFYNASDNNVSRMSLLPDSMTAIKTGRHTLVTSAGGGQSVPQENKLALMPIQALRPSWRQLQ
ncbi:PilC/PilY family type IV pilus protein [Vandammella animalimorsus]|uniref:pilus assembly protein n=1 Tax=Vandammella animalimorsus TaxID=2029117 RepID=UPI00325AC67A